MFQIQAPILIVPTADEIAVATMGLKSPYLQFSFELTLATAAQARQATKCGRSWAAPARHRRPARAR
jgi:hypothetical protein